MLTFQPLDLLLLSLRPVTSVALCVWLVLLHSDRVGHLHFWPLYVLEATENLEHSAKREQPTTNNAFAVLNLIAAMIYLRQKQSGSLDYIPDNTRIISWRGLGVLRSETYFGRGDGFEAPLETPLIPRDFHIFYPNTQIKYICKSIMTSC